MIELFINNYKAHRKYLESFIECVKDKEYFHKASNEVLYMASYVNNIDILRKKVHTRFVVANVSIPNKYYIKAFESALDILNTLDMRFVKGAVK